jgi:hypothetical protein
MTLASALVQGADASIRIAVPDMIGVMRMTFLTLFVDRASLSRRMTLGNRHVQRGSYGSSRFEPRICDIVAFIGRRPDQRE